MHRLHLDRDRDQGRIREVLFVGKVALPDGPGYASDHIGLYASLLLAPP